MLIKSYVMKKDKVLEYNLHLYTVFLPLLQVHWNGEWNSTSWCKFRSSVYRYVIITSPQRKTIHRKFFIYREIFYTDFPPYSAQLLLSGVEGRSMWVKNGLSGLEGLKSFSKRRNGSLGTMVKFLYLIREYGLKLINDLEFFCLQ